MPTIGSDADRLQAIQGLDRAIHAKLPALNAAQARHDAASRLEAERRRTVKALGARIQAISTEEHRRASTAYLNGKVLDRGTLAIGNEELRFSGWHGKAAVPLQNIGPMDTGQSHLPPRAGIPILERVWPGEPRPRETLLLTVQRDNASAQSVVLADLSDAGDWLRQIEARKAALRAVELQRSDLKAQQERAQEDWDDAKERLSVAEAELSTVQNELAQFRRQRATLQEQQRQVDAAREQAARSAKAQAKRGGKR